MFFPLIHGLCAFFNLLLTPLSTAPSPPPSQFTVCTSRFARLQILLQIITARDAKSACFKGCKKSCDVILSGVSGNCCPKNIPSRDGCSLLKLGSVNFWAQPNCNPNPQLIVAEIFLGCNDFVAQPLSFKSEQLSHLKSVEPKPELLTLALTQATSPDLLSLACHCQDFLVWDECPVVFLIASVSKLMENDSAKIQNCNYIIKETVLLKVAIRG